MTLSKGMSLSLYCVGDPEHPGNHFLNGDTVQGQTTLEANSSEPLTGTRWYVADEQSGVVVLECLGDLAGPRYLNGHTNDAVAGRVDLVSDLSLSGTRWLVEDDDRGGMTLRCMGVDVNSNFQFLDGRTAAATPDQSVGLAPSTNGVFTGTHWEARDVVDHTTARISPFSPALAHYLQPGANVFGVAMAWATMDGHIAVQRFLDGQQPDDITMLVDTTVDRPALTVRDDLLYLAFTAPNGNIHVMRSADAHVFDTVEILEVGTSRGPGLTSFGGLDTIVAWVDGSGGQIHVRSLDTGVQADLAETSNFAPALAASHGPVDDVLLFLAWTGTDPAQSLNTHWSETIGNLLTTPGRKKILPDTSIAGPALVWRDNENTGLEPVLILGWTGHPGGPDNDTHLNIALSTAGTGDWDSKRTVSATSGNGPALTYFTHSQDPAQAVIFTAWTENPPFPHQPPQPIETADFMSLPVIPT